MNFNWDDYPVVEAQSGQFDWNQYPPAKEESPILDKVKEFGQATLNHLPEIGAMGGGMAGMASGGPGLGMAGAGAGGYLGKASQNFINSYIDPEKAPKTHTESFMQPLKAGAEGVGSEILGQGLGRALGAGAKKGLELLGPSAEAISARIAGRAKDSAKNFPELAENMVADVGKLSQQIGAGHEVASKTLGQVKTVPRSKITQPIYKAIHDLKIDGQTFGPEDRHLIKVLDELGLDATKFGDKVSEKELFRIIRKLDDNINWNDQTKNVLNGILKGIRRNIDTELKTINPKYAKEIQPVHKRMEVLEAIEKRFNLKRAPGKGHQATDTTASNIQSSLRENKDVSKRVLEALEKYTGNNYQELAKDYQNAKHFNQSKLNGARRTAAGTAIGAAIGQMTGNPLLGAAIGGPAGAMMDIHGGAIAGKMIDLYASNPQVFGRFGPVIAQAVKAGPKALAVVKKLLSQNPEFQKQIESLQESH